MRLCICQLIKDEQQYIEEWIEYHHNLGFNKFYLIEDWNSSSHKDILKKYNYVELHKLQDICNENERTELENGKFRQRIVYNIFNRLWRKDNDWMAFIDVDEYIDTSKEYLEEVLESQKNKPIVTMIWKTMTANGHIRHPNNWQKYSLIDTYKEYNFSIQHVKQIINCNPFFDDMLQEKYWLWLPHHFRKAFRVNLSYTGKDRKKTIFIKHFLSKSFEEWLWRLNCRGEQVNKDFNRTLDDWFKINDKYLIQKDEIISQYIKNDFKVKTNEYIKK